MPLPVRPLPLAQSWDCSGCGDCCRSYQVRVTAAEKTRIDAQGWDADPALAGVATTVPDPKTGDFQLAQRPDGTCVFLGADNRCRIHVAHGPAGKPMACRVYPFVLVPGDGHWRVGLRYACPAAAGTGRPLAAHAAELREYAGLVEADIGKPQPGAAPPELQPGQGVPWADLERFTDHLLTILDDPRPLEFRLRLVLAVAALCKGAAFEKVSGRRLTEFLQLVTCGIADELPPTPAEVPAPGWVGRMVFRQTCALYARADGGPHPGVASRGRWTRIRSAYRFAVGTGDIPRLHGLMPATTFEAAEQPVGPLPEADDLLARYYRVKLQSMQFVGPTHFGRRYWAGLDALVLTFPVIRWLGRVFATPDRDPAAAVRLALQVADANFGFNPLLAAPRQEWAVRTLADRGEIARLAAWYAR
jgi:lysine-N-methylase